MKPGQKNSQPTESGNTRIAGTGNASNPSTEETSSNTQSNQLLDEKAGDYIREAGNIEDLPDEGDEGELRS